MDDLRQEKAHRERLAREKEIAIAEKFTIEQNLSVRFSHIVTRFHNIVDIFEEKI